MDIRTSLALVASVGEPRPEEVRDLAATLGILRCSESHLGEFLPELSELLRRLGIVQPILRHFLHPRQ